MRNGRASGELHHPFGIAIGKRLEQHRADHSEHRRIRPNPQRQSQHRGGSEAWILAQRPQGEAQVVKKTTHMPFDVMSRKKWRRLFHNWLQPGRSFLSEIERWDAVLLRSPFQIGRVLRRLSNREQKEHNWRRSEPPCVSMRCSSLWEEASLVARFI